MVLLYQKRVEIDNIHINIHHYCHINLQEIFLVAPNQNLLVLKPPGVETYRLSDTTLYPTLNRMVHGLD